MRASAFVRAAWRGLLSCLPTLKRKRKMSTAKYSAEVIFTNGDVLTHEVEAASKAEAAEKANRELGAKKGSRTVLSFSVKELEPPKPRPKIYWSRLSYFSGPLTDKEELCLTDREIGTFNDLLEDSRCACEDLNNLVSLAKKRHEEQQKAAPKEEPLKAGDWVRVCATRPTDTSPPGWVTGAMDFYLGKTAQVRGEVYGSQVPLVTLIPLPGAPEAGAFSFRVSWLTKLTDEEADKAADKAALDAAPKPPEFKAGDWVRVRDDAGASGSGWSTNMAQYRGKVFKIDSPHTCGDGGKAWYLEGTPNKTAGGRILYWWREAWLTPVPEPEAQREHKKQQITPGSWVRVCAAKPAPVSGDAGFAAEMEKFLGKALKVRKVVHGIPDRVSLEVAHTGDPACDGSYWSWEYDWLTPISAAEAKKEQVPDAVGVGVWVRTPKEAPKGEGEGFCREQIPDLGKAFKVRATEGDGWWHLEGAAAFCWRTAWLTPVSEAEATKKPEPAKEAPHVFKKGDWVRLCADRPKYEPTCWDERVGKAGHAGKCFRLVAQYGDAVKDGNEWWCLEGRGTYVWHHVSWMTPVSEEEALGQLQVGDWVRVCPEKPTAQATPWLGDFDKYRGKCYQVVERHKSSDTTQDGKWFRLDGCGTWWLRAEWLTRITEEEAKKLG
jgi:hypothetical protein